MPGTADVCAIIVTYHPDEAFRERFARTSAEVAAVFIVDNGSNEPALAMIAELVADQNHVLVSNGENLGVATALNQGVRAALDAGFRWAVTLDQDSTPLPGMVTELLQSLEDSESRASVAIVVPNVVHPAAPASTPVWLRPMRGMPFFFERVPAEEVDASGVTMAITSGALTNLSICRDLGYFWDDLFIDFVDFEYCLRARRKGFVILVSPQATLLHRLADKQHKYFLGIRLTPLFHPPARLYYIWRNRIAVMKRHGSAFVHWSLYELSSSAFWVFRILAVEGDRWAKLRAMAKGTIAGFRGSLGPMGRK